MLLWILENDTDIGDVKVCSPTLRGEVRVFRMRTTCFPNVKQLVRTIAAPWKCASCYSDLGTSRLKLRPSVQLRLDQLRVSTYDWRIRWKSCRKRRGGVYAAQSRHHALLKWSRKQAGRAVPILEGIYYLRGELFSFAPKPRESRRGRYSHPSAPEGVFRTKGTASGSPQNVSEALLSSHRGGMYGYRRSNPRLKR